MIREAPTGAKGLVLAAASSGSGKTLLTLALLRHFRNQGRRVAAFKIGPDYIDPAFHTRACSQPCFNLDAWAMADGSLADVTGRLLASELIIGEGVMGLFDGAVPGLDGARDASSAAVAKRLGLPVIVILDVRGQGATAAAVLRGLLSADPDLEIAGVIFNNVGSIRHESILESACRPLDLAILGYLPRNSDLHLPARHLGLVQAEEHGDLEVFLEEAAAFVAARLDTEKLLSLAGRLMAGERQETGTFGLPPLGQRIAVARDPAFAFCYAHLLAQWRDSGAETSFFSPLEDEGPDPASDAVYLPGGYPELHAGRLAAAGRFRKFLHQAVARGAAIYGECGGYMVLGQGLVDSESQRHAMAGLLPVETSFAAPKRVLGYRRAELLRDSPLGKSGQAFRGHEFHFAQTTSGEGVAPLFRCWDSSGRQLPPSGCQTGRVQGSFLHLIDRSL